MPGETILLHVINAGLEVHEAVIGDAAVQDAWETAEAATVGAPPGPTPVVQVPADVAGVRIVVHSGERVDLVWTVPADAAIGQAPATPGSSAAISPDIGPRACRSRSGGSTGEHAVTGAGGTLCVPR